MVLSHQEHTGNSDDGQPTAASDPPPSRIVDEQKASLLLSSKGDRFGLTRAKQQEEVLEDTSVRDDVNPEPTGIKCAFQGSRSRTAGTDRQLELHGRRYSHVAVQPSKEIKLTDTRQ